MKVLLEVGRNFLGHQIINVAKLVSQSTSEGDGASHDRTTFTIGDTSLAGSTRITRENNVRSNKALVSRPVFRIGVELALQRGRQQQPVYLSNTTHQEDMDEEGTFGSVLPAAQVSISVK
jgi:hypothetical protein